MRLPTFGAMPSDVLLASTSALTSPRCTASQSTTVAAPFIDAARASARSRLRLVIMTCAGWAGEMGALWEARKRMEWVLV